MALNQIPIKIGLRKNKNTKSAASRREVSFKN